MYFLLTDEDDSIPLYSLNNAVNCLLFKKVSRDCPDGLFDSNIFSHGIIGLADFPVKILSCQPNQPIDIFGQNKGFYIGFNCKYIRSVILVKDSKISLQDPYPKFIRDNGSVWFDKMILGSKYYLGDPNTIRKFNIEVNESYINNICAIGDVKFLEWWKNSGLPLKYDESTMDMASQNGHVNVLEWLKNSGLSLEYERDYYSWDYYTHNVDVLEWWFNSGLEFEFNSGLEFEFSDRCGISYEKIIIVYKLFQKIMKKNSIDKNNNDP
jgi:hypothetical protein